MRVLVTGARGFVGRNLCCALKNIRDGKDRREKYAGLLPLEVMEWIGNIYLDDSGRDSPASLNSTGDM